MNQAHPFYLGGIWQRSDQEILITNAYDHSPIGSVSWASRGDVLEAIQLAFQAQDAMRSLSSYDRWKVLDAISKRIADYRHELEELITQESGKPIKGSRVEVERSIVTFQMASEEAKRMEGEFLPLDVIEGQARHWAIVRRFPLGVVAAITPFNSPLNLVAHKIAPALASGNCVILKPAPQTPLTSLYLAKLIDGCGIPPGSLSVIPCNNEDAEPLITDDRIGVLSFTGSLVGWELKAKAIHKKVTLEMGGNGAVIIHEDADLDLAVSQAVAGAFSSSGQRCISVQRIYLHRSISDLFLDRFLQKVEQLVVGNPMNILTDIGPLITEEAAERTVHWINEAIDGGAELLAGGKRFNAIVSPTVLRNPPKEARICREEVFAPVVVIFDYEEFEKAIDEVNDSIFGLQASVFTNDIKRIFYAFETLEVGGVMVNESTTYRMEHMPYGGQKNSGFGREGVRYAIEGMTERKILVINLN